MQSRYLPPPALLLLRNKLLTVGGSGCGNLRLALVAGCWGGWGHGEGEGTWHPLHGPGWGSASLPSAPSLCASLCAGREAGEVLLCVGQLV